MCAEHMLCTVHSLALTKPVGHDSNDGWKPTGLWMDILYHTSLSAAAVQLLYFLIVCTYIIMYM